MGAWARRIEERVWNVESRADSLRLEAVRGETRRLNPHRARLTAKRLSSTRFYPEGRRSDSRKQRAIPALRIKPSSLGASASRPAADGGGRPFAAGAGAFDAATPIAVARAEIKGTAEINTGMITIEHLNDC